MDIVISEAEGLRLLRFGTGWCQGAMRIAAPDRLELEYAVRMSAWLLFHDPDSLAGKHLVTLGLGAGSLTRFAHGALRMQATAVEIDAAVIAACRTHFMLPAGWRRPGGRACRRHRLHGASLPARQHRRAAVGCVRRLGGATRARQRGPVRRLPREPASGRHGGRQPHRQGAGVRACVDRLRRGLQPRAVWQFPPTGAGNVVVIAHCGETPPEEVLAARAAEIEQRWGLPAPAWLAMARRSPGTLAPGGR
jgi:hypothetical protein